MIGDPIPSGQVEVDGRRHSFTDGFLRISSAPEGMHTLAAHAAGYTSATRTIEFPTTETVTLGLEYLTAFEFVVYSEKGSNARAAGAEVILWAAAPAHRPIPQSTTVHLSFPASQRIHLRRDDRGVRVVDVEWESARGKRHTKVGEFMELRPGDLIIGVAGCMWRSDYQSVRRPEHFPYFLLGNPTPAHLRAWDAIVAHADCDSILSCFFAGDYLEVQRGTKRFYSALGEMTSTNRGEVVARRKTDSRGVCRFENLPPGLYVAQARRGEFRSRFSLLHTALAGSQLRLKSGNTVLISVKRSGVPDEALAAISGANVHLTLVTEGERGGLFLGETNVLGKLIFSNVPWGEYILSVAPPPQFSLPTKTFPANVDRILNRFEVVFESRSFTASGKVLNGESGEPVGGITLELFRTTKPLGSHGVAESSADGSFRFIGLFPGQYMLFASMKPQYYIGYLPPNGRLLAGSSMMSGEGINQELTVTSEDINNIQYFVLPGVRTRFQGKVTTPQGLAVKGAKIVAKLETPEESRPEIQQSLPDFQKVLAFVEPHNHTNENGRFDLSIITAPDKRSHVARFLVTVVEPPQPEKAGTHLVGSSGREPERVSARGFGSKQFRFGDSLSDLHIIVEPLEYTVSGKIYTESGDTTASVKKVFAFQDKLFVPGEVEEDGSYRVKGLHPGPFILEIQPFWHKIESGPFAGQLVSAYCSESLNLRIEADKRILPVDITLAKASHLAGKLVDENHEPVGRAFVVARSGGRERTCRTDEDGFFWLHDLPAQKEHVLEVSFRRRLEPVVRLEGVRPPDEHILIVVPNSGE